MVRSLALLFALAIPATGTVEAQPNFPLDLAGIVCPAGGGGCGNYAVRLNGNGDFQDNIGHFGSWTWNQGNQSLRLQYEDIPVFNIGWRNGNCVLGIFDDPNGGGTWQACIVP